MKIIDTRRRQKSYQHIPMRTEVANVFHFSAWLKENRRSKWNLTSVHLIQNTWMNPTTGDPSQWSVRSHFNNEFSIFTPFLTLHFISLSSRSQWCEGAQALPVQCEAPAQILPILTTFISARSTWNHERGRIFFKLGSTNFLREQKRLMFYRELYFRRYSRFSTFPTGLSI